MARRFTLGLVAATMVLLLTACADDKDRFQAFAQCLTDKGVKMYGAYWCPHCQSQKDLFGKKSFANVTYIECAAGGVDAQPALCAEKAIKNYPTWEFPDGSRTSGELSMEILATKSGCQLPPEENKVGTTTGTSPVK